MNNIFSVNKSTKRNLFFKNICMCAQRYIYNDVHYRKTKQNKIKAHQKASYSSFFLKDE